MDDRRSEHINYLKISKKIYNLQPQPLNRLQWTNLIYVNGKLTVKQ